MYVFSTESKPKTTAREENVMMFFLVVGWLYSPVKKNNHGESRSRLVICSWKNDILGIFLYRQIEHAAVVFDADMQVTLLLFHLAKHNYWHYFNKILSFLPFKIEDVLTIVLTYSRDKLKIQLTKRISGIQLCGIVYLNI